MKKLLLTLFVLLNASRMFAQNKDIEAEIRSLEQREVQAIINKIP